MENKEININKKALYSTDTGVKYVEMMYPEGWSITIKPNKEKYGGYTYPYVFRITLKSPDKQRAVNYFSPRNFIDDHLKNYQNNQIDDYGNLLHTFTSIDDYLETWAQSDLKNNEDLKKLEVIEVPDMTKQAEERKAKSVADNRNKGYTLLDYYYRKLAIAYSYTYNNVKWVRMYAGIIEAEHVGQYRNMPIGAFGTLDPVMKKMLSAYLPKNSLQQDGNFSYPLIDETRWSVRQLLTMDCRLEDYKDAYKDVFVPTRNEGVKICDDIWKDFEAIRKKNSAEYEKIRQKKQEAVSIRREAAENKRQRDTEFYEQIRKTQQETRDILKSSYENQRKTQNKISEMWSDVNRGNTRFVDRDGNEHVIHTYNDYAYKSGDHYVTSDSPLDHSYDWEELEKKKY